ncbi:MAG: DUF5711 family protein [Eubacteriales bacterium]
MGESTRSKIAAFTKAACRGLSICLLLCCVLYALPRTVLAGVRWYRPRFYENMRTRLLAEQGQTHAEGATFTLPFGSLTLSFDAGQLTLYGSSGEPEATFDTPYHQAHLVLSGDYFYLYETGTPAFSVYSRRRLVRHVETEGAVYALCAADTGACAVLTDDPTHASAVQVYGRSGRLTMSYQTDTPLTHLALSSEGRTLAVTGRAVLEGAAFTETVWVDTRSQGQLARVVVPEARPLCLAFFGRHLLLVGEVHTMAMARGKILYNY